MAACAAASALRVCVRPTLAGIFIHGADGGSGRVGLSGTVLLGAARAPLPLGAR